MNCLRPKVGRGESTRITRESSVRFKTQKREQATSKPIDLIYYQSGYTTMHATRLQLPPLTHFQSLPQTVKHRQTQLNCSTCLEYDLCPNNCSDKPSVAA